MTHAEIADALRQIAQELELLKDGVNNQFVRDHKWQLKERLEDILNTIAVSLEPS